MGLHKDEGSREENGLAHGMMETTRPKESAVEVQQVGRCG